MEYKDKIIAAVAEKACEHVATNVIKTTAGEKKEVCISGDDSGLKTSGMRYVYKCKANQSDILG